MSKNVQIIELNKSVFKEQFNDSQVNQQEIQQLGQPIQLVRIDKNDMMQLNQKALQIITQCDLPVGFITLIGKYRTGKSYLLNKLLNIKKNKFRVNPATTTCTQGIWMWSNPALSKTRKHYLFFLDTQGLGSLEKGPNLDSKIFTLSCLLSSFLIYNSVGPIDTKSIQELDIISISVNNIIYDNKLNEKANQQELSRNMPKFIWLLRDFNQQIRDSRGKQISPDQYLQAALDVSNSIRANQIESIVKKYLSQYFKQRQCMVLVRPAIQQSNLMFLEQLSDFSLSKQFLHGVDILRQKIAREAGPKIHNGEAIFGDSAIEMIEYYVEMMNKDEKIIVKNACLQTNFDETQIAYQLAIQKFSQLYTNYFSKDKPKEDDQLKQILLNMRNTSIKAYEKNVSKPKPSDPTKDRLKQFIRGQQKKIININNEISQVINLNLLSTSIVSIYGNIEKQAYAGKKDALNKDINQLKNQYQKKSQGSKKQQTLAQFMSRTDPILQKATMKKKQQGCCSSCTII